MCWVVVRVMNFLLEDDVTTYLERQRLYWFVIEGFDGPRHFFLEIQKSKNNIRTTVLALLNITS